ncbi:MAG: arsenate reductase ArsC [Burkholderiales bacterium]
MRERTFNVLFLCTGNSARSILAEAILNDLGGGRFRAYSAGSRPSGTPNPFATELLARNDLSTAGLRSKSWDEFAQPEAPAIDIVVTVCDSAAAESCPIWPGRPIRAHWGIEDPAAVQGTDEAKRKAFRNAYDLLHRRLSLLVRLPVESLAPRALQDRLDEIGQMIPEERAA